MHRGDGAVWMQMQGMRGHSGSLWHFSSGCFYFLNEMGNRISLSTESEEREEGSENFLHESEEGMGQA